MDEKKIYKVANKLILGKEQYLLRNCFGNFDTCSEYKENIKRIYIDNFSKIFYLDCIMCKNRSKKNVKKD